MIPNHNLQTGIAFGYASISDLDGDLVHELLYGAQASNLSEAAAREEEEARQRSEWENNCEADTVLAQEEDWPTPIFPDFEVDLDNFDPQIEEPVIEGVYENVHYRTVWLGGAMMIAVAQSPIICTNASRASPCLPGQPGILKPPYERDGDVLCYDLPNDWWAVDPAATTFEEKLTTIEKEF